MKVADLYIKVKEGHDGEETEELWVALRKANGKIVRKLRFIDYEKIAMHSYPLRNQMLLHFYKFSNKKCREKNDEPIDMSIPKKIMTRRARKKQRTSVKVIGIDMNRTYKPDNNNQYYHYYFNLSDKPPERWMRIFTREGEKRMKDNNKFKYAWLEENHIVIRCNIRELRTAYLADIKVLIKATNSRYQKYLDQTISDIRESGIDNDSMNVIVKHMFKAKQVPS